MIPLRHDGPLDRLAWDGHTPVIWRAADPGRGQRAPLELLHTDPSVLGAL